MAPVERIAAAEFLGVSVSTLDRLASQGRLTRGRAKRKTRPVTIYDEGELHALRDELNSKRPQELHPRKDQAKPIEAIGFRLDRYYVEKLAEEGGAKGMSAGEYARSIVIRALEGDRERAVGKELATLRRELAEMFYHILVQRLEASEEEAVSVVENLLRESR